MWIAGPDKRCTDVNRPWLDFTGQWIAAVPGNGWTNSVHPGDLSRCLETYHRTRSIGAKPSDRSRSGSAGTTANIDGSSTPARRGFSKRIAALKATSARRLTSRTEARQARSLESEPAFDAGPRARTSVGRPRASGRSLSAHDRAHDTNPLLDGNTRRRPQGGDARPCRRIERSLLP